MTTTQRSAMLAAITRHGQSLLAAFPKATERNPDTLARKLRSIETKVYAPILAACNGTADDATVDAACEKARAAVRKLLGLTAEQAASGGLLVINHDPRGYALKLREEWTREHNRKQCGAPILAGAPIPYPIHSDWGGYGILAPDLTPSQD